jgi:photosystem II stability/assembly factor-like uncharacterized protein
MVNGWYQQFMPNLGGKTIQDMTFLDSLTGYTSARQTSDTSYILKTSNGGNNWQIIFRNFYAMTQIQFLNVNTGYAVGAYLYKTTNGGFNWEQVSAPPISPQELYVLNEDTIWLVNSNDLTGGVYRTPNGGASWDTQYYQFGANPSHIYMFNARFGFMDGGGLKRTTDGGFNWTPITGEGLFFDMYFADSLTGWKCNQLMKKTTDGGLTWINQTLPSGGLISMFGSMLKFTNVNRDTIWGVGGYLDYGGNRQRGFLYSTTNTGSTWRFQIPDTSFGIPQYMHVKFVNKLKGWAYSSYFSSTAASIITTGAHTTSGGNDTFFTSVQQTGTNVPDNFYLGQNYPNPFNPITKISYELRVTSYVGLHIYDITGKEITTIVDGKQNVGTYEITFDGSNYSSGIYFYSLFADGKLVDTKKMILLK